MRRTVTWLLALLLGVGAVAGQDPYAAAVQAYSDGDYRAARARIAVGLQSNPADARLHFLLGVIYRDDTPSRLGRAAEELRRAIDLDPRAPDPPAALAEVLRRLGRNSEAIEMLQDHLRINPADALAQARLGLSLQMVGRGEEGLQLVRQATRSAPLDPGVWLELGRALHRAGKSAAAVEPLLQAVQLDPQSPFSHYALAQAYLRSGREAEAERILARYAELLEQGWDRVKEDLGRRRLHRILTRQQERLRQEPDSEPVEFVVLADFYRRAAAPDQGAAFFAAMAAEHPRRIGPLLGLAVMERSAGDPVGAWSTLERARALSPLSPDVLREMTRTAGPAGRLAELDGVLQEAGERPGSPPEILLWRGVLEMERGRLREAAVLLLQARELLPEEPDVMLNLGVLQARKGNTVQAMLTFQALVDTAPGVGEAWYNLAMAEVRMGILERAPAHLERALFILGDQAPALNLLAELRFREGDTDVAALLLERSLAVDPEQPEIRAQLRELRKR